MRLRHIFIFSTILFILLSGCEEEKSITYIAWSPDGSEVAFSFGRKIFLGKPFSGRALERARCILEDGLAEGRFVWAPSGDSIYFARAMDGSVGIWKVDLRTGAKRRISKGPVKAVFPAVDPRGSYLVYLSYASGFPDLYLHNLDTGSVRQLTSDPDTELSPVFSPSGKLLTYVRVRSDEDRSICLIELPSGEARTLLRRAGRANLLKFSPDGRHIAYTSGGNIYLVPAAARAVQPRLIGAGESFDWTGDGEGIIVSENGVILRRSIRKPGHAESILAEAGHSGLPALSPEGDFLALALGTGEAGSGRMPLLLVLGQRGKFRRWLYADAPLLTDIYAWSVKKGWYEDALWALKKAEEEGQALRFLPQARPTSVEIERAKILLARGQPQKAAELLEASGVENFLLAKIYLIHLGNFSRAKEILDRLAPAGTEEAALLEQIKNLPARPLALYARALRASEEKDFATAVKIRQDFLKRYPGTKASEMFAYDIGEIYWKHLGEPDPAFESLGSAIKRYPHSPRRYEALRMRGEIARKQGDYQSALAELSKAIQAAPDDDARLNLVAGAIKISLERLHNTPLALELARETMKYEPKGDAGAVVGEIVNLFDSSGLHQEANTLLGEWIEAYDLSSSDIGGLLKSVSDFGEETFVEVRLDRVPDWFEKRLEILAKAFKTPEEKAAAFAAAVLLSRKTSEGLIRTWENLRRSIGRGFKGQQEEFEEGVLYIIANVAQNEGNLERALDYYARLSKAARNDTYLQTIEQCQAIISSSSGKQRRQTEGLIREFLNIERESRTEFWGDASELFRSLSQLSGASKVGLPAGKEFPAFEKFYRRLIEEGPEPLKDNAAFRLLAFCRDGEISFYTALEGSYFPIIDFPRFLECWKFCEDYPTSEFFERAFESMADACEATANNWLFSEKAKEILGLLRQASRTQAQLAKRIPGVLLALGKINCSALSKPLEGENYYREIIEKFPDSPERPDAQWRLSLSLAGRKKYAEARQMLQSLIKEAPTSRQVKSGNALRALAGVLEAQGEWPLAENAYIRFIADFKDHPEVKRGDLLERIYPRLSNEAKRLLFEQNPQALRRILPRLSDFEREKLLRLIPELKSGREFPPEG